MKHTVVWFMVACGLFLNVSAAAQSKREKLKDINERLEKERKNLEDLKSRKTSVLDVLDGLSHKISDLAKIRRSLNDELILLQSQLQEAENEITKKKSEVSSLRRLSRQKMTELYKMGELGTLKILFSSDSFADLVRRSYQMEYLVKNDLATLVLFEKKLDELEVLKKKLEDKKIRVEEKKVSLNNLNRDLLGQRQKKQVVLTTIASEEDVHQRYIAELDGARKNLESLLENLSRKKRLEITQTPLEKTDQGFSKRKGRLQPPVQGKVVKKFGKYKDPKFYTYQFNKGIQIDTKPGSSVRGVFNGTVVFSGWFKGFGQIVIIDHGGGYHTLSAHNQEVFKNVGDAVREGDVVALLEAPQDLSQKEKFANLYFEVREAGKSVDPLDWLSKSGLQ